MKGRSHLRSACKHLLSKFNVNFSASHKAEHKTIDIERGKSFRRLTQASELVCATNFKALALAQHYASRQVYRAFNFFNQLPRRRQSTLGEISHDLEPVCSTLLGL